MRRGKITILLPIVLTLSMAAAGCGESAPAAVSGETGTETETGDTTSEAVAETAESVTAAETADIKENRPRNGREVDSGGEISYADLIEDGSLDLQYATEFQVDNLVPDTGNGNESRESGEDMTEPVYHRIIIPEDDQEFLLVPEGASIPSEVPDGMQILQQPLDRTYLVSTSVMDDMRTIDAMGQIRFSGTKEDDWTIREAQEAMDLGYIDYAGKYNQPDYELILGGNCNFAIENTMIYHNPEVREKLMDLGIPVLVERSSYERNPLGRLEWIRLYGVLYNKEETADSWYENEIEELQPILQEENTGTTAAFFAVQSNGAVTIRKPGDYISRLIEMAGGNYIFTKTDDEDDNALSTMTIQMEEFYATAKDADVLIYNSTIEGEISSMQDLLDKNSLFADFKAVKDGNVYCTGKNLYQEPTGMGEFLEELHAVFTGADAEDLKYLTKVE